MVGMLVGMTTTIIDGACGIDINACFSTPPISMFLNVLCILGLKNPHSGWLD